MPFNPDWTKQVQEIIFSRKTNIRREPSLYFNNAAVKHLDIYVDSKLSYTKHINDKINKAKSKLKNK